VKNPASASAHSLERESFHNARENGAWESSAAIIRPSTDSTHRSYRRVFFTVR